MGAHLDFLMDELKAFALVAAVAVRLWLPARDPRWLLEGLAGLVVVAAAISLTTFMRRPEYAAATGAAVSQGTGDYGEGFEQQAAPRAARRSRWSRRSAASSSTTRATSGLWRWSNRVDIFLHAYC